MDVVNVGLGLGLEGPFLHLLVPSSKCGYPAKSMKKEARARLIGSVHKLTELIHEYKLYLAFNVQAE